MGLGIGALPAFTQVSDSGATLQSAAQYGNTESFHLLLAHGAILSNAATMHAAAEGENIEIMAHLLKLGVGVDQMDGITTMGYACYDSPLLQAMLLGKPQAVRFLLDHGASTLRKLPGRGWQNSKERLQWICRRRAELKMRFGRWLKK
jgi:hypothetical protein